MAGSDDPVRRAFSGLTLALDGPMFIVTAAADGERSGCLIGFGVPCSVDPQRFMACLSKANRTHGVARRATHLAVHVVPVDAPELAELFGGETGDEVDKFARVRWHYAHGAPILDDCERWFAGAVLERIPFGDHIGFLLEPIDTEQQAHSEQLTYQHARDIEPGHKP